MHATKYVTKRQLQRQAISLDTFPSAGPRCNITGMKQNYWGHEAYCLKHGAYVYKVPREIWLLF